MSFGYSVVMDELSASATMAPWIFSFHGDSALLFAA
jgi:hypothetical protein